MNHSFEYYRSIVFALKLGVIVTEISADVWRAYRRLKRITVARDALLKLRVREFLSADPRISKCLKDYLCNNF